MLFKKFFVTSGVGLSGTSELNAFDRALMEAGICQCNLIPVSSIIPEKARQTPLKKIKPGSITFTVLSRIDGEPGSSIAAGLGWALCVDEKGRDTYGIVVEDSSIGKKGGVKTNIALKLKEAVASRRMKIKGQYSKVADINKVPEDCYGSAIVALVYTD
jgi:arginine decarboxylase